MKSAPFFRMFCRSSASLGALGACLATPQVFAQDDGLAASDAVGGEIVVRAARLKGQLDVDQPPLLELGEADIAAEGVTSIADLVTQISSQTSSARGRGGGGRPIILVNGIRIGSFREFAQYPPEALARVEVFPEEVAQRFGFDPDRRVVNLILKENFSSREIELEFAGPSRGGYLVTEQEAGLLTIKNGGRINLNIEANDTSLLTEAERGLVQTPGSISQVPGDPDQARYRSLVADARSFEASANWAKAFLESGTSVSASLQYDRTDSRSLSGLNIVTLTDPGGASALRTFGEATPLERRSAVDSLSSSGSLTTRLNAFRLTSTFDASLSESETEVDRRFDTSALEAEAAAGRLALDTPLPVSADAGFDIARSTNLSGELRNTLSGPTGSLPAGEVQATFDFGVDWQQVETSDTRSLQASDLTRRRLFAGTNLVLPITSRRNGAGDGLGDVSLTLNAGLDDLSDFGLLGDYSISLNWSPVRPLDISASYITREVAPSLGNLGDPRITTFNAPVFDFVNGETVLATVVSGGNPALLAETQRDWKLSASWELGFWENTRVTAEYIRNRSDDVTAPFPVLTREIEAAFPDRVTRDASGRLISLDRRAVTFAETRADRLQLSLTTRGGFGASERGRGESAEAPERARPTGRPAMTEASPERREAFAQFRARLCAEDGLDFIVGLVERVDAGEDVSTELPGIDSERLSAMLARVRDENGAIDRERLASFRDRLCAMSAGNAGQPGAGGPPRSEGSQARGGGGGGPFGGGNPLARGRMEGWRYFLSLNHTIELANEIIIAPGLDPLDQLDGDGTAAFGLPRHASRLEAGLFGGVVGFRLSGQYTGPSRIDGSGLPGSTDLMFGDLVTFDLRAFTDLGELLGREDGFLKRLRVSLRADNIFDSRRKVTDANGQIPVNYQPFLIDPTGRYLGIELRKLF